MSSVKSNQLRHRLFSLLWLLGISALPILIGWSLFGSFGLVLSAAFCFLLLFFSPRIPTFIAMRLQGAAPLGPQAAPQLFQWVEELSRRAGLDRPPQLYYLPSSAKNAFVAGNPQQPGLAVTDGLLRLLNPAELRGVLAHEISHLANRDLYLMNTAAVFNHATRNFSLLGQILLLINLPLFLLGGATIPWGFVLLLMAAPLAGNLMQSALSRTREFKADLGAVRLTGETRGLASALHKLELGNLSLWARLFFPYRRGSGGSSWMKTHPNTKERIRRLLQYRVQPKPVVQTRSRPRPEQVFLSRRAYNPFLGETRHASPNAMFDLRFADTSRSFI